MIFPLEKHNGVTEKACKRRGMPCSRNELTAKRGSKHNTASCVVRDQASHRPRAAAVNVQMALPCLQVVVAVGKDNASRCCACITRLFPAWRFTSYDGCMVLPVGSRSLIFRTVKRDPTPPLLFPEGVAHHRDGLHRSLVVLVLSLRRMDSANIESGTERTPILQTPSLGLHSKVSRIPFLTISTKMIIKSNQPQ